MIFSDQPKDFTFIPADSYQKLKIQIDSFNINYVKKGSGPAVVLVHGLTNNWFGWGRLIPELEQNFTVYALDLLGYGDSDELPSGDYSVLQQAELVGSFIHEVVKEKAVVVGLSMGSVITAEVGKLFSQNLLGIVLLGPVFNSGRTSKLTGRLKSAINLFNMNSFTRSLNKSIVSTRIFGYAANKFLHMYRFKRYLSDLFGLEGRRKMKVKAFFDMGISVADYDLALTLRSMNLPILLIFGKYDKVSQPDQIPAEIREKDSVKVEVIDESGHVISVEKPKEVAEKIIDSFSK